MCTGAIRQKPHDPQHSWERRLCNSSSSGSRAASTTRRFRLGLWQPGLRHTLTHAVCCAAVLLCCCPPPPRVHRARMLCPSWRVW